MLKKVSLTVASLVLLSGCSACSTLPPEDDMTPVASPDAQVMEPAEYGFEDFETYDGTGTVTSEQLAMLSGQMVHFEFDSAALTPQAQAKLREAARDLKKAGVDKITIEGHCDERGTREYNLALGDRRAVSVKKFLTGLGVNPKKMVTISYGKERPLDPRHTEAAWDKNRRSVLVVE